MIALLILVFQYFERRRVARPAPRQMSLAFAEAWLRTTTGSTSPSLAPIYAEAMSVVLDDLHTRAETFAAGPTYHRGPAAPTRGLRGCITATSSMTHPDLPPIPPRPNDAIDASGRAAAEARARIARRFNVPPVVAGQPAPPQPGSLAALEAELLSLRRSHSQLSTQLRSTPSASLTFDYLLDELRKCYKREAEVASQIYDCETALGEVMTEDNCRLIIQYAAAPRDMVKQGLGTNPLASRGYVFRGLVE